MRGLFTLVLAFLAIHSVLCQSSDQGPRRRRIRKKIAKIEEPEEIVPSELEMAPDDRNGRGFLDDLYAPFASRFANIKASSPGAAETSKSNNDRMDYSAQYEVVEEEEPSVSSEEHAREMPEMEYTIQKMQMKALRRKQEELEIALQQKKIEEQLIEEQLKRLPTNAQIQPELRAGTRYVQQVSLPNSSPDENTYMYSSVSADDPSVNEILPSRSMTSYTFAHPDDLAADTSVYSSSSPDHSDLSRVYSSSGSSMYSDAPTSSSADPLSRFFGVTGTTSQDIQLGLTFTVPFLSLPLNSLQSMIGGNGIGDFFNNFNFDTTSLITIAIIAGAAIFILPQVIYWLTGVNLSAFNWGRSEEHGMNVAHIANMIDEALKKYDVDTKSCMARTMCNQYAKRMLDGEEETVQRISRGLIENIANNNYVKKYMGEGKVSEALKYGQKGKDCSIYYSQDVCPWDTSAMIKIASRIMTSGNIDFASIAAAAASKLMQSRKVD